jgi:hypothetical protein
VDAYRLLKCIDERAVYRMLKPKNNKPSAASKRKIINKKLKSTKKNIRTYKG